MRYDQRARLVYEGDKRYNPNTGKTEKDISIIYTSIPCHKSPLSPERTAVEFGNVQRDVSIIRLRGQILDNVSHAYIDDRKYIVVRHTYYRHDTVMYLEQVNNGKG